MLWEDAPSQATATRLQARGVQPVPFRPCASRPATGDFLSVMRQNIKTLEEASTRLADPRPSDRQQLR